MFDWFRKGGAPQSLLVLFAVAALVLLSARSNRVPETLASLQNRPAAALTAQEARRVSAALMDVTVGLERMAAPQYDDFVRRVILADRLAVTLDRAALAAAASPPLRRGLAELQAGVADLTAEALSDTAARRERIRRLTGAAARLSASLSPRASAVGPPLVAAARAQDYGAPDDRLALGGPDLRPLARVVVLLVAMVATLVSGVLYVLADSVHRREASFRVMTYLGAFVGGTLF